MIYFIDDRRGAIKIGYSQHPESRLKNIGSCHAIDIHLLAVIPGDGQEEKELHYKFSHLRLNGEWFLKTEELVDFIVNLNPELNKEKVLHSGNVVMERVNCQIEQNQRRAERILKEARERAIFIINEARRQADNIRRDIITRSIEAEKEAGRIINDAEKKALNVITEAMATNNATKKKINVKAQKGDMFIFDCRCCNCGCATTDVEERANGMPYCQECWKQHLGYQGIAAKAYELGYGTRQLADFHR